MRVALSALTMAEYFRDQTGVDTLLFIDNIFRFSQAGSQVSALLGRMPSAVGYQPTLGTEMGELQGRITSTQRGAFTSIQAVYVPADDCTDPAQPGERCGERCAGERCQAPLVAAPIHSSASWSALPVVDCGLAGSAEYPRPIGYPVTAFLTAFPME